VQHAATHRRQKEVEVRSRRPEPEAAAAGGLLLAPAPSRKQEAFHRMQLEKVVSLIRFLEATAAPGTQIGTPPRLL
jgi:hypothetical protein